MITGGGSGIGRELVVQLAGEGCSVAIADLALAAAEESAELALAAAPAGVRATAHRCDVADPSSVERLREEVIERHGRTSLELLFNNAGVAGAGSFVADDRASWARVFSICWGGVYNCSRAFLPLLLASERACIVNTSSVNGFWAKHGPGAPATAYATAKFAVKGFSEALIEDLRTHAPHVRVAVVMPGTIGTGIVTNSARALGADREVEELRSFLLEAGVPAREAGEDEVRALAAAFDEVLREFTSTSAAEAAAAILDGVRAGRWRILVGADARELDEAVRNDPEVSYEADFAGLREPPWLAPALQLRLGFDPQADPGLSATIELRDAGQAIAIEVAEGRLTVSRGVASDPDVTVELGSETMRSLLAGEAQLSPLEASGALELRGDRSKLERLLAAVRSPETT